MNSMPQPDKLHLDDVPQREVIPGYRARFVHGERQTHAWWEIDPEVPMAEHSHPHEQVMRVLEGTFELTVEGTVHVMEAGDLMVIPPNVPHGGKALTASRVLDVFSPVREDYR